MRRLDCVRRLADLVTDELVVMTMTGANWEWRHVIDHEPSMNLSAMGNGAAVGMGMALGLPHRGVVVLESDGSSLLDLATLTTLGTYQPVNLSVFVFDNEVYSGSGISEPTATAFGADLAEIAKGAGIKTAQRVTVLSAFEQAAREALNQQRLSYVVAKVEEDASSRGLDKPTEDHLENKYRFVRHVERTEGVAIFGPGG